MSRLKRETLPLKKTKMMIIIYGLDCSIIYLIFILFAFNFTTMNDHNRHSTYKRLVSMSYPFH